MIILTENVVTNQKPICPTCHRKTVNHYVRSKKEGYASVGYWCLNCQASVQPDESVHTFNAKLYQNSKEVYTLPESNQENIEFTYLHQPPRKWTFQNPEVRKWIESHAHGKVLNLFAGKVRLSLDEIRVDMEAKYHPDYVMEAEKALDMFISRRTKFDTIILDPPYSHRKGVELYNGNHINHFTKLKNKLPDILNTMGSVITLGYDSIGMGKVRGFRKKAIALVCHGRLHKDTIILEEVLSSRSLPDQEQ